MISKPNLCNMKQGWEIKKLGEVASYINGYAFKPEHWVDNGIPIIRIQNLNKPNASFNFCNFEIPSKYIVERGDILISWSASLGVYEWNSDKGYLNQHIFKVVFDKGDICKYYLKYVVSTKINDMLKNLHGATMKHIVKKDFDNIQIPVPPLAEQEKIVAELDCLSGVIEKKKQQLKELDALAQSIFYEMFGATITSKFQKYQLSQLSEYKLTYGSGASAVEYDGIIRYVRITDIQEDGKLGESIVSPSIYEDKYLLNDGDILFARSGATVGKTYHYKSNNGRAIYAGYLIRFIPNKSIVLPEYIFYYTRSEFYKSFIKQSAQTVAQPNINAKQYGELIVPLPPLALQQSFASKIEAIEKQKELIKKSIEETETLFNSRMDYYFN